MFSIWQQPTLDLLDVRELRLIEVLRPPLPPARQQYATPSRSASLQCSEQRFDAEASVRGLVSAGRALAAAKRLMPGLLEEADTVNHDTTELSFVNTITEASHGVR
ncbi:hypothetical protein [Streptomyces sp. NPDC060205]|uniref:hypothetical protein n=1 Tax=Streptomyces sp. NPDC060205 TaxID=3347072 RepID=UPI00364E0FE5